MFLMTGRREFRYVHLGASRVCRYMVDWLATNFVTRLSAVLHMCVFTVSEPSIIRLEDAALKGGCGVQRYVCC